MLNSNLDCRPSETGTAGKAASDLKFEFSKDAKMLLGGKGPAGRPDSTAEDKVKECLRESDSKASQNEPLQLRTKWGFKKDSEFPGSKSELPFKRPSLAELSGSTKRADTKTETGGVYSPGLLNRYRP